MTEQSIVEPLRLAIIGGAAPSMIGAVHRIGATMDGHFRIVAGILSSDPVRGREAGLALGIAPERIYRDMDALVAGEDARDDRIDAVSICTPNDSHFAYAKAALSAGYHAMLDKPLCNAIAEGEKLEKLARASGRVLALTHAYAGYPMIREMRARILRGEIGTLRMVQVEYLGSGLAERVEEMPGAEKRWRLDPDRSGPSLVLGDIGTHAHHLACFTTGMTMLEVSADVGASMSGRRVHDYAHIRFAMEGGVRGAMFLSQAAAGAENDILVRVFGSRGHAEWRHRDHTHLKFAFTDGETRIYGVAHPNVDRAAARATRFKRAGHPEGLHEAFANLYADFAELVRARQQGRAPDPGALDLPQAAEGMAGLRFVMAALASSAAQGAKRPI
jgi:predicted dehydrogenase